MTLSIGPNHPGGVSSPAAVPHVVVITTGGTVASSQTSAGAVPTLRGAQLVSRLDVDVGVRIVDVMAVDSSALQVVDQFRIVDAVLTALLDDAVVGVVVTHGTDTMEESAFLVDLYLTDDRPVVFTGAQFTDDSPQPDGPANLALALSTVADPTAAGGVWVAMGGVVLPARGLFKRSTSDVRAFDVVHHALARPRVGRKDTARIARVDLLALYPGVSPGLIAASVAQNAGGLVLAATGSGNTHPDITAEVALAVAHGTVVIVTTRVPYGEVVPTYGGGGGAVDLVRAGAVVSAWLRAPQARMALVALLSHGATPDDVAQFFARSGPVEHRGTEEVRQLQR